MSEDYPLTLMELENRFSSDEACRAYLITLRWPNGWVGSLLCEAPLGPFRQKTPDPFFPSIALGSRSGVCQLPPLGFRIQCHVGWRLAVVARMITSAVSELRRVEDPTWLMKYAG
jgi:hypothetical protein